MGSLLSVQHFICQGFNVDSNVFKFVGGVFRKINLSNYRTIYTSFFSESWILEKLASRMLKIASRSAN